jgi:hypothetical protein
LRDRSITEGWVALRDSAQSKSIAQAEQRTAEAAADNATLAAELKNRLLARLMRIEQKYPLDATEVRTHNGNNTAIFKIRDLTAAYKDIVGNDYKEEDETALKRLDELLEVAWNAAHTETG